MESFRERYRDFQELVREHQLLRQHNRNFGPTDPQDRLLMFAEGALVILMVERFLRILPDVEAKDNEMLCKLLDKVLSGRRRVLTMDPKERKFLLDFRNTILHGNFEQAARQAKLPSKEKYFETEYAAEIEAAYEILNRLVEQIDPETGRRKQPLATIMKKKSRK